MVKLSRESWHSQHTGRSMPVLRYGDWGPPLVYVPSSHGDEREFERYRMHEVSEPWVRSGRVQVFSIDGYGPRSLFSDELPPPARIGRYAAFECYAVDELLPWVGKLARNERLAIVGCSYGGFVAANLWLKQPARVRLACGLGGVYGLWHRLDGLHDDDVYSHTPLEYLPRLEDTEVLGTIRKTEGIDLYAAADDEWLASSRDLARILTAKSLPHRLEVWPAPANHHERWWRRQIAHFLESRYGAP